MCKYSDNKGEWFEMWYSDKKMDSFHYVSQYGK